MKSVALLALSLIQSGFDIVDQNGSVYDRLSWNGMTWKGERFTAIHVMPFPGSQAFPDWQDEYVPPHGESWCFSHIYGGSGTKLGTLYGDNPIRFGMHGFTKYYVVPR